MNKRKHTDAEITAAGEIIELPLVDEIGPMTQLVRMKHSSPLKAVAIAPESHTFNHINCPACWESNLALQATDIDISGFTFSRAAQWWILLRQQSTSLRERTHETTFNYLKSLEVFFGALPLRSITPGHIRCYQMARLRNEARIGNTVVHPWKRRAGNSIINHEISALAQILTHAKLWKNLRDFYFPLSIPNWSPRQILSEEQEKDLWLIAQNHPEAKLAYWVALITDNTSGAGLELRGLRLKNLVVADGQIAAIDIPEDSVKNNSRPRKVPLNPAAKWAVGECLKRAIKAGSCQPDHYLFPFRKRNNKYDPTRPATRWFLRKSWDKLREATGFRDLKPHDLRHHCITRLLESGVEPETVHAIAGHVGVKMMEYYSHHRHRIKHDAVMKIETPSSHPLSK